MKEGSYMFFKMSNPYFNMINYDGFQRNLYYARENTANQTTGKPLYARRYYIQPSHMITRCAYVALIVLATVFSTARYKIAMQRSLVVYHKISHLLLVSSRYIHALSGEWYTEEIQVTRGIFHVMVYHKKALHN